MNLLGGLLATCLSSLDWSLGKVISWFLVACKATTVFLRQQLVIIRRYNICCTNSQTILSTICAPTSSLLVRERVAKGMETLVNSSIYLCTKIKRLSLTQNTFIDNKSNEEQVTGPQDASKESKQFTMTWTCSRCFARACIASKHTLCLIQN